MYVVPQSTNCQIVSHNVRLKQTKALPYLYIYIYHIYIFWLNLTIYNSSNHHRTDCFWAPAGRGRIPCRWVREVSVAGRAAMDGGSPSLHVGAGSRDSSLRPTSWCRLWMSDIADVVESVGSWWMPMLPALPALPAFLWCSATSGGLCMLWCYVMSCLVHKIC